MQWEFVYDLLPADIMVDAVEWRDSTALDTTTMKSRASLMAPTKPPNRKKESTYSIHGNKNNKALITTQYSNCSRLVLSSFSSDWYVRKAPRHRPNKLTKK